MLYELNVIDHVCDVLIQEGYEIVSRKMTKVHLGVDIIAKKKNDLFDRRLFIEAVGETSSDSKSKKFGLPFDSSQSKVHVAELFYECAKNSSGPKISGLDYKYGIAVPDNEIHRRLINEVQLFLEKNNIAVFFVLDDHVNFSCKNWSL